MSNAFLDRLGDQVLVCDGAMGTVLYSRGIFLNHCFDEVNLTNPSLIQEIHKKYIEAGADIIETNTYGANRFKLSGHGLADSVAEVNAAGVRLARKAVSASERRVLIAGSVGPLGKGIHPVGPIPFHQARSAFREQIHAIAEGGVDLLIIETISSLAEMKEAVAAAQEVCDLPIVCQFTFNDEMLTMTGESPESVVPPMVEMGVDVLGVNCSLGPQPTADLVEIIRDLSPLPISAQPNAGAPQMVDGRFIYLSTPEYLAHYAQTFVQLGVTLVGGCCGTTPEHIKAIKSFVRGLSPRRSKAIAAKSPSPQTEVSEAMDPVPLEKRSALGAKLGRQFVVSVEIDPPRGLNPEKALQGAELLEGMGVDAINIADGPRASSRMSPLALACLISERTSLETILHYCCRDRNILGMQSDLIGSSALGRRNILAVTGDPPKMGDYPDATAVFDVDSIGLVRILTNLNRGIDMGGKPLGDQTAFTIGVGANPAAVDMTRETRRLWLKHEAGAEYIMTQPVYDDEMVIKFLEKIEDIDIPVLLGLLPLASFRNAEFLHNEVPGMSVPDHIRDRMKKASKISKEAGRAEGAAIAREALEALKDHPQIKGIYVMPPFGRYEIVKEILEILERA